MSHAVQIAAITVSLAATVTALTMVTFAARTIVRVIRLGQPDPTRHGQAPRRWATMLTETLGHTRLARWRLIGIAHWWVFIGFGALFFTLVTAYGQLFDAHFALPVIGHWWPYELGTEVIAAGTAIGIGVLIVVRLASLPSVPVRKSRFAGSTAWQAYYVEWTIVAIVAAVFTLRGLEGALAGVGSYSVHYPVSYPLVRAFSGLSPTTLSGLIYADATLKILVSMAWFAVIATNLTMGVAWHRFTAFVNVYFRRRPGGGVSLGPLQPIRSHGELVDFSDPGEDDVFGTGTIEDFTWKALLDFTTCTECGRCQSQCPAWNTAKPLSPKLLVMGLREHVYAKAPYLLAGGEHAGVDVLAMLSAQTRAEADRPLVGPATSGGVIDPEALWACTTCGACVEACPVDIEHVDHIVDLRRYQVLMAAEFPHELNGLFKNLETKGNPWGMNASARLDWAADLPFEVPVVDGPLGAEVEYLFWVGCAGAYDDRARKTTRAVAELLHLAGVRFAVLGPAETCTGDPARRAGNEFLFQELAAANVATLNDAGVRTIVATCAHCFNTLHNEYPQLGGQYQVLHHTQLLDRLVREGRLTPVSPPDAGTPAVITYHDPCYLGRHNEVYAPPRELLGALPGVQLAEMPRSGERSFCCGAGGARMWMEERLGKRINMERTDEALSTGAGTVAVACPYCKVMLGDGVTARAQEDPQAATVEVLDVAQLLLGAVRRG
ncbi:MAG: (Fe-S)-binding protein [Actinomycetes bacterium]